MASASETNIYHLPAEIPFQYDSRTPVTAHDNLMATMYGDFFRNTDTVLNVAAGHTDLGADLRHRGIMTRVTSFDPIYEREPGSHRVPGYAQAMPFADESFAMTTCQFGMQHLPEASVGDAIREMVRVTRTADSSSDPTKGIIFINPVFRPERLQRKLVERGADRRSAGIMEHDLDGFNLADRKVVRPTLWIQKTDALTPETLEPIIAAVVESEALRPAHRSLGELASRAFGGHSKV